MCLILLHCVKKKGTKPLLASILLACLFNSCHEQSYSILHHWPHPSLSPVWLLPWNCTLPDAVKHTYLSLGVLAPLSLSLNFHLLLWTLCHVSCLYIHPSFAFCILIRHSTCYSTSLLLFLSHFQQRIPRLHPLPMPFLLQLPYLLLSVIFISTFQSTAPLQSCFQRSKNIYLMAFLCRKIYYLYQVPMSFTCL